MFGVSPGSEIIEIDDGPWYREERRGLSASPSSVETKQAGLGGGGGPMGVPNIPSTQVRLRARTRSGCLWGSIILPGR